MAFIVSWSCARLFLIKYAKLTFVACAQRRNVVCVCVGGFLHTKPRAESWLSHFHSDSARLFFFAICFWRCSLRCSPLTVDDYGSHTTCEDDDDVKNNKLSRWSLRLVMQLFVDVVFFKFIALNRRMDNGIFFQRCPAFWVNVSFIVGSHAGRRRRLYTTQFFSTLFFFVSHFDKNSYKYLKAIVCAGCRSEGITKLLNFSFARRSHTIWKFLVESRYCFSWRAIFGEEKSLTLARQLITHIFILFTQTAYRCRDGWTLLTLMISINSQCNSPVRFLG